MKAFIVSLSFQMAALVSGATTMGPFGQETKISCTSIVAENGTTVVEFAKTFPRIKRVRIYGYQHRSSAYVFSLGGVYTTNGMPTLGHMLNIPPCD